MPQDPPVPSTPPPDPDPSTRPPGRDTGPQPPPLPAPQDETVWRYTFLAQFTNPADRKAIQRFGGLLYTATFFAGYAGNRDRLVAADDLDAVADDLDALAAAVPEISPGGYF